MQGSERTQAYVCITQGIANQVSEIRQPMPTLNQRNLANKAPHRSFMTTNAMLHLLLQRKRASATGDMVLPTGTSILDAVTAKNSWFVAAVCFLFSNKKLGNSQCTESTACNPSGKKKMIKTLTRKTCLSQVHPSLSGLWR